MKKKPYDLLILLWGLGITITLFTTSLLLSWEKYKILLSNDIVLFAFTVALASLTFGLFISYLVSSNHELNILNDYLEDMPTSRLKPKTYIVIIGLALFFGILIAVSDKVLIYSITMVFYNLFDVWAGWQVGKRIGPLIDSKMSSDIPIDEKNIVEIIKNYYFSNPASQRIVTIMFINWVVVCLSLSFYFTNKVIFRNCAYTIIILNIVIGTIVLYRWRIKYLYKID